jgi:uncharacterized C2H2 Zn-finger protein
MKLKLGTNKKEYGERKCPYCSKIFFSKKSLDSHIGGAHRKDISKTEKPTCKKCGIELVENVTWASWAKKQGNLICKACKKQQNKESYYRKKERLYAEGKNK